MTEVTNLTDREVVRAPWAATGPWLSSGEVIGTIEISSFGLSLLRAAAEQQLSQFSTLQSGWDSYGAPPIDPEVIVQARRFLTYVAAHNLPGPFVVPTSKGGIAFEWRRATRELALEIDPRARTVEVYFADDDSGDEWEHELASTWSRFLPALVAMER